MIHVVVGWGSLPVLDRANEAPILPHEVVMKSLIYKLKELIDQDRQVVIELGKAHFYQGVVVAILNEELVQLKVKGERKDKEITVYIPTDKIVAFWEGDVEKSVPSVGFLMGRS